MSSVSISARFEPESLSAYARNEALMSILLSNSSEDKTYWCECDVAVKSPLSLAHDRELNVGRTRVGILKPGRSMEKQIKLYTRPNNFPDDYPVGITVYLYDEDGAISERLAHETRIACKENENAAMPR